MQNLRGTAVVHGLTLLLGKEQRFYFVIERPQSKYLIVLKNVNVLYVLENVRVTNLMNYLSEEEIKKKERNI